MIDDDCLSRDEMVAALEAAGYCVYASGAKLVVFADDGRQIDRAEITEILLRRFQIGDFAWIDPAAPCLN